MSSRPTPERLAEIRAYLNAHRGYLDTRLPDELLTELDAVTAERDEARAQLTPDPTKCAICNGRGTVEVESLGCHACRGTGKRHDACAACDGSGTISHECSIGEYHHESCEACDGMGRVPAGG